MSPELEGDPKLERLKRDIEAMVLAADRRGAEHAARVARELGLDELAERFQAEAEEERPRRSRKSGKAL